MRLIPALAENFAYRFASFDLTNKLMEAHVLFYLIQPFLSNPKNEKVVELHAILSVFKPISTAVVQARIQPLREILGGHGYSRLNKIGAWRNDNDINLTWEGDNTVLIQQTSRFLTNCLKKKMKGKQIPYTTVSFLSKFSEVLNEKIDINNPEDLKNINLLLDMLEHKCNLLLQKSVIRLSELIDSNITPFDAWNDSQIFYLQNLARCYGELYVFNCFKSKIEQLVDSSTKNVLLNLLQLFGLTLIEKDLALLRENDYIQSNACDLIKNEVLNICKGMKNELITVLDVISPPDEVLGAAVGTSTGFIFDNYLNGVYNFKGCFERADWWEILHHKKI